MLVVNSHTSNTVIFNGRPTTGILNGAVIWGIAPGPTYTGTATMNLGFNDNNFNWTFAVNKTNPSRPDLYSTVSKGGGVSSITASSHATANIYITASSKFVSFPDPPAGLGSAALVGWGKSASGGVFTARYSGIVPDGTWKMESGIGTGKKCIKIVSVLKSNTAKTASSYAPWYFVPGGKGISYAMLNSASSTSFISSTSNPYRVIGSGTGASYLSGNSSFGHYTYTTAAGSGSIPVSGRPRLYFNSASDVAFSGRIYAKWESGTAAPSASMGAAYSVNSHSLNSATGLPYKQVFTGSSGNWSTTLNGSTKWGGAWANLVPVAEFTGKNSYGTTAQIAISAHSGQWSASGNVR